MAEHPFVDKFRRNYIMLNPDYINYLLKYREKLAKILSNDSGDINDYESHKLIFDIKELFNSSSSNEIIYALRCIEYVRGFIPISINPDASKDIEAIKKEKLKFGCSSNGEWLKYQEEVNMYDPVTDIKFNFGLFEIMMYPNQVACKPVGNNTSNGSIYHPYLSPDYRLCLGQYANAYSQAMLSMRFYDASTIINHVLFLYGGNEDAETKSGPHGLLSGWIGVKCEICGSHHPADTSFICAESGSRMCKDCIENLPLRDEGNKMYYMPKYIGICSKCNKNKFNFGTSDVCVDCRRVLAGV